MTRRQAVKCALRLDGYDLPCPVALAYDDARERVRVATEEGYLHVELPVLWTVPDDKSLKARDSLVLLRSITALISLGEAA